jgi:pilus assembly protein Flp/PilA
MVTTATHTSLQAKRKLDSHAIIVLHNLGVKQMKSLLSRFVNDQSGATAIEYALIASGIGIAIIVAVNTLGGQLSTTFGNVTQKLQANTK